MLLCAVMLSLPAMAEGAVRVASLKGPTTMGMVRMIKDDEQTGAYEFTVAGAADEVVPLLVKGDVDIALIPANLAAVLYGRTEGKVGVKAINTLGVLYIVEAGDSIHSVGDLKGKTICATGKGTTPEYALRTVLTAAGMDPEKDVTIEYKSEATEAAAALAAGQATVAMLPQPFVTAALAQNEGLRVALSLTEAWDQVMTDGSALVTGVVAVRRDFAQSNPEALEAFMEAYRASTAFVNENPEEASEWIADLGIVAKAGIALKAIPACNIVCIEGEEMQSKLSGYLNALYNQDPASVGGALPLDDFYL
ncbi:MAG: ABC transporter substrate-binding protein [Clostridia bacterium]|nr:ABC transporter substrate-binding protein [Clostridia bacterium]